MSTQPTLTSLAKGGAVRAIEDRWMPAIEAGGQRDDLLEALSILTAGGRADDAAALAWTWLAMAREKGKPDEVLGLGRALLLRCGDSDDLRGELLKLYKEAYPDRPELDRLIDIAGLAGGKSPRRALRTLDICLNARPGDYLLARSDEHIAEVLAVNPDEITYRLKTPRGQVTLDADALAMAYDPVPPGDFRVLMQFRSDTIKSMLESDHVGVVIGILQSHHGRIDSDRLEQRLVPRFLAPADWRGWWSKAKTALKRSPNVVVEGRNPVVLTYHAQGQSLEDEIEPQWSQAETPAQRLATVDTYVREAKGRSTALAPSLTQRMIDDLVVRVRAARKGSPRDALREALVLDRLGEVVQLPEDVAGLAGQIIAENPDSVQLLAGLEETPFLLRALGATRQVFPEKWPELFATLLPLSTVEGCDAIARALDEAQGRDLLEPAVGRIPADFLGHLDALCWLWRGPSLPALEPMPPRELLIRLLNHLAALGRGDIGDAAALREARVKIRAALSAAKYTRYRQVIEGMEPELASTIRRSIERLDGLGQVVHSTLLRIIEETHPELYVKARLDPWLDEGVIFATQAGMKRREEELNHLVNVKMPQNAKAIGEAASHGDLSENSEYKFALEERDLLRARVATIQNELALARLLTANDVSTERVNVGTRITLQSTDGSHRQVMTILGPWEADIEKGIYNYRAPLCTRLRGLQVGEVVNLDLDGGEHEYRIESIENALEGSK